MYVYCATRPFLNDGQIFAAFGELIQDVFAQLR